MTRNVVGGLGSCLLIEEPGGPVLQHIRNAPGEPRFEEMERVLAKRPRIEVPTIVMYPTDDGITGPPSKNDAGDKASFSQLIDRRIVQGAGHFMPREKPEAVASALVDVLRATK